MLLFFTLFIEFYCFLINASLHFSFSYFFSYFLPSNCEVTQHCDRQHWVQRLHTSRTLQLPESSLKRTAERERQRLQKMIISGMSDLVVKNLEERFRRTSVFQTGLHSGAERLHCQGHDLQCGGHQMKGRHGRSSERREELRSLSDGVQVLV